MVRRWGDLQACVRAWAHRTCRRCRGCSRSSIADGCDSHTGHGGHGVTSGPERSLARIARLHSWIGVQEGPMESARTTVRHPGSLRGAATVMVGFAVASGTSAPSPVYAPRSDRVRPLTPAGGAGSWSLREQGWALLRSGAEQSQSCLPSGAHSSLGGSRIVRLLLPMTLWTILLMDRRWTQQRWARWVRCSA